MTHYPGHLVLGIVAFVTVLAARSITVNRLIVRKLRVSLVLLGLYVAGNLVLAVDPALYAGGDGHVRSFEQLALAAAFINAFVFLLANPLREDRVPDRFPVILQDAVVIALVLASAMFLSSELVTTSAVSAVVLGFALQDTLGNAFAGLAIQSEKPFNVGHWVRVGDHEGRVAEVTWRATKLRTKAGNFVILPNNVVSKEPIVNYSEPALPTRIDVEVGASYLVPPNQVKAALLEAVRHCSSVLATPPPEIHLQAFADSAITYRVYCWIDDFARASPAQDEVRTAIFYSFRRHGIEIPWPIQVEYKGSWPAANTEAQLDERERILADVDIFTQLPAELRSEIARLAPSAEYGAGEAIVRQGEPGQSMFVLMSGAVSVVLEPLRNEVARIGRGGYFGEMSLLTGDPRTATVLAVSDVSALELNADLFRRLAEVHPKAIEQLGVAAVMRRADLERVKASTATAVTVEATTLLTRMKKFLRLS